MSYRISHGFSDVAKARESSCHFSFLSSPKYFWFASNHFIPSHSTSATLRIYFKRDTNNTTANNGSSIIDGEIEVWNTVMLWQWSVMLLLEDDEGLPIWVTITLCVFSKRGWMNIWLARPPWSDTIGCPLPIHRWKKNNIKMAFIPFYRAELDLQVKNETQYRRMSMTWLSSKQSAQVSVHGVSWGLMQINKLY